MNLTILKTEIQTFINNNLKTDITKLVLKGSPFKEISTVELISQIEAKKKCKKKLPTWFNTSGIYFPNKLNIEQTSSEVTASYKANLIKGNTIIDITGGYGVDCWAFSKTFKRVIHCELNNNLSAIAKNNYEVLKVDNIENHQGDGIDFIIKSKQNYDYIYVDPSRRNNLKEKVFLLHDCLPNIPLHLESLLEKSNHILIKNSPLIDITNCINELKFVKKIQVIAIKNEVKEVLVHIEKNYIGKIKIKAINLRKFITDFEFTYQKDYSYHLSPPLKYLYEPNSAILKSGGFFAIANKLNLFKLHKNSHLYTANNIIDFPGRSFRINEILPYHKKQILKRLPERKANITTRNFKESVSIIRKKTGIKEGGNLYLFFTTNMRGKQIVLLCNRITNLRPL